MSDDQRRTLCYFDGPSIDALRAALAEYPGPATQLSIVQHGAKYELVVCEVGGDGDPINDSHLCPGSPGCP
jgi:L-arabinose isomerase